MPKEHCPVIILVRPQLGENIGAVARAMGNFGFQKLRLVAPRDGWPNTRALEVASDGKPIVEAAKVFPDLMAAMRDVHTAYAATARPRDMVKRVMTPEAAMQKASAQALAGHKVAFVFGPERTGLENEEIVLCDTIVTIPTDAKNSSLNLAQSAVVLMYEWFRGSESKKSFSLPPDPRSLTPATKKDWKELFAQLDAYLEDVNYYRTAHKKRVMWQNMQNMLLRGAWSEQEVRTFRGMLRILYEGRKAGVKTKKR